MTKEEENKVIELYKDALEKAKLNGLANGAKTISTVVYKKIENVNRSCSKNDLLRIIKDLKEFCEVGLKINTDIPVLEENPDEAI